jgi:Leucine-rich repeat (LRR) protein
MTIPLHIFNDIQFYLGNDEDVSSLVLIEPDLDRYYHNLIKNTRDKPPGRILRLEIKSNLNLNLFANLVKLGCSGCKMTSLPEFPNLTELYCDDNRLT